MRRGMVLGALVAMGVLTAAAGAFQQPAAGGQQAPRVVMAEKLKDNLWVMRGGGGNSAVFIGASGVTVVDTKNPGWGQPLLDEIRKVTDKPITTIINTHTHGDHVSGNVEFPANVEVVTHANTAANMQKMATPSGIQPPPGGATNIFKQHGGHGLPKRTFTDRLTLGRGNEQIDLYYFGRGHTNGDTLIVFRTLRTMHAGDLFARKSAPIIDTNNGGSGVEYPKTLARAVDGIKDVDTVIPGHSDVTGWKAFAEYADFMRDFFAAVQGAQKSGKTAEQAAADLTLPGRYKDYGMERAKDDVEKIYKELQGPQ